MLTLQTKKPSSVAKRKPGQQQNSSGSIAAANDSKFKASNVTYLFEANDKSTDTLTVLRCCHPNVATKTHSKTNNGLITKPFNAGGLFDCTEIAVSGIGELSIQLTALESIYHAFLIRGLPLPHVVLDKPHPRRKHGSQATYLSPEDGRYYVMLDIDKLKLPDGLELTPDTVMQVVDYVISLLPSEFHGSSFHWQLSSSAGLYNTKVVSMHIWCWLAEKATDDQLKRWGNKVNADMGFRLIDTALFNDVQPHFTAAPIFEGMDDPFPSRSGLVTKPSQAVKLVIPPANEPLRLPITGQSVQKSSGKGFDYHLDQIGDHHGGDGFNGPIIRAIASYVATVGADHVDHDWLIETVRERILSADSSNHEQQYVDEKAGDRFLDAAIDGAIRKFGHKVVARILPGQPPHHQTKRESANDAVAKLKAVINRFFR